MFTHEDSNIVYPKMIMKHQVTILVALIDKIYHHFHHHVLFLRLAFGYHQREGHEGVVGNTLGTILAVKNTVVVHKPEEERSGNTFVSVTK